MVVVVVGVCGEKQVRHSDEMVKLVLQIARTGEAGEGGSEWIGICRLPARLGLSTNTGSPTTAAFEASKHEHSLSTLAFAGYPGGELRRT